jgi:sec-independent protein translocase protein TatA
MMVLFLNDISGSEVLLILVFVLMFFGSKSIPGLAKTLGRTMRQIKDASSDLQNEIRKSGVDMKKDLNLTALIDDTARDIQQPLDQYVSDLDDAVSYQPPPRTQVPPPDELLEVPEGGNVYSETPLVVEAPTEDFVTAPNQGVPKVVSKVDDSPVSAADASELPKQ